MKFTYINFFPLLEYFKEQNLIVSFMVINGFHKEEYEISSILHHKDFKFKTNIKIDNFLKNSNKISKFEFLKVLNSKMHNLDDQNFALIKNNDNNYLLSDFLKDDANFNSIVHDQILTSSFIKNLEIKCEDPEIYKNINNNTPISLILEHGIEKNYLENIASMSLEDLEKNLISTYQFKLNNIAGNLLAKNICPLDAIPINNRSLFTIIKTTAIWLENNYDEQSIGRVMSFFNQNEYKKIFSETLQETFNRSVLEQYIFSIDKNNDENFKNTIYQNFPSLKFETPIYTQNIKKESIHINIASILKKNSFDIFDTSFPKDNYISSYLYKKSILKSHSENILKNMPTIISYCSKFYGLKPFKIKQIKGSLFSIQIHDSNIEKNKEISEFIDIMLYELFTIAKPIEKDIIKTLESILPTIYNNVLNLQVPKSNFKKNLSKF